jgi:chromosome partitioning protein
MRIWAIFNHRGASAKTTTVVTLAGMLAAQGARTLMVDLDPAGGLTSYFGLDPYESLATTQATEVSVATGREPAAALRRLIRSVFAERLYLLPGSPIIGALNHQRSSREGLGLLLSRQLSVAQGRFDYVLVDCPPGLGLLLVNALASCDVAVIPVRPEAEALAAATPMFRTLDMVCRTRRCRIHCVVLPVMCTRGPDAATLESIARFGAETGHLVWQPGIPVDPAVQEARQAGMPLSHLTPQSPACAAYEQLLLSLKAFGVPEPLPGQSHRPLFATSAS